METTLLRADEWAQVEFGEVSLGDLRRAKRLSRVASALAKRPSGTLPTALTTWKELKSGYRLLANEMVRYETIMTPHWERTRQMCQQKGEYLVIEDSTQLDFTQRPEVKGLGRIGDDRGKGLCLHSSLAARIESWSDDGIPHVRLMGLFYQKCWVREEEPKKGRESRGSRLKRKRESERWGEGFRQSGGPPEGSRWIYLADRESDIYEVFEECQALGIDFIVRACQARVLEGEDQLVFKAVARARLVGRFKVELRARPGVPARTATVELRARRVTLRGPWRPDGRKSPILVNVVEAKEIDVPMGVEPIYWVLITSLPIETFREVKLIVGCYSRRWLIEEYHKALKTGAGVEETQLSEVKRIKALLGILAIVAVRLLNMKLLVLARPETPVEWEEVGEEVRQILEVKIGKPKEWWDYRTLLVGVARLGGFLARKGDGNPGWITIWRGWNRLMDMAYGYRLATVKGG